VIPQIPNIQTPAKWFHKFQTFRPELSDLTKPKYSYPRYEIPHIPNIQTRAEWTPKKNADFYQITRLRIPADGNIHLSVAYALCDVKSSVRKQGDVSNDNCWIVYPWLVLFLLLLGSHQVEWKNSAEEQEWTGKRDCIHSILYSQARKQQVKTNIFCRKIPHAFSIRWRPKMSFCG